MADRETCYVFMEVGPFLNRRIFRFQIFMRSPSLIVSVSDSTGKNSPSTDFRTAPCFISRRTSLLESSPRRAASLALTTRFGHFAKKILSRKAGCLITVEQCYNKRAKLFLRLKWLRLYKFRKFLDFLLVYVSKAYEVTFYKTVRNRHYKPELIFRRI